MTPMSRERTKSGDGCWHCQRLVVVADGWLIASGEEPEDGAQRIVVVLSYSTRTDSLAQVNIIKMYIYTYMISL